MESFSRTIWANGEWEIAKPDLQFLLIKGVIKMNLPIKKPCTCRGGNPACFKCGGWGFVRDKGIGSGGSSSGLKVRKKSGITNAKCPICNVALFASNLSSHLTRVHNKVDFD
jgi:hypothetical protein